MRLRATAILATLGALSLTACQESAVKVPNGRMVLVIDRDGNVDQRNINAVCLSSGVKTVHYFKWRTHKGAFVECR